MQNEAEDSEMVFVVMPFSDTKHYVAGVESTILSAQWDHIYTNWIKRAIESYKNEKLFAKRSPAIPGNFVRGIIEDLAEASWVIADLTGSKSNVYYELGIRHALRTGSVIITQDLSSVPSDLRNYYTFEYKYSEKGHEYDQFYAQFERSLHEKFDAISSGQVLSDSPVSDFLGFRAHLIKKTAKEEKAELKSVVTSLQAVFEENFYVCDFVYKCILQQKPLDAEDWLIIDVFPLESLYNKLTMARWQLMPRETVDLLADLVRKERKYLLALKEAWDTFRHRPDEETGELLHMLLENAVEQRKVLFEQNWQNIVKGLDAIGITLSINNKTVGNIDI